MYRDSCFGIRNYLDYVMWNKLKSTLLLQYIEVWFDSGAVAKSMGSHAGGMGMDSRGTSELLLLEGIVLAVV